MTRVTYRRARYAGAAWTFVGGRWEAVISNVRPQSDGGIFKSEMSPTYPECHPMAFDATTAPGAVPQAVSAPLTRAAIFLVVTVNPGSDSRATVRSFCGELAALLRAVEFRDLEAGLSCVMGIGSDAWDRLFG